eukprot:COSAG06_NODE_7025_length_2669_cov_382.745525_3_plen_172_part_00
MVCQDRPGTSGKKRLDNNCRPVPDVGGPRRVPPGAGACHVAATHSSRRHVSLPASVSFGFGFQSLKFEFKSSVGFAQGVLGDGDPIDAVRFFKRRFLFVAEIFHLLLRFFKRRFVFQENRHHLPRQAQDTGSRKTQRKHWRFPQVEIGSATATWHPPPSSAPVFCSWYVLL